jgi:DNA-binding GntR family transcriptional regulator
MREARMTHDDIAKFRARLDAFSDKLARKREEYAHNGQFGDVHRQLWDRIEATHARLHHRAASAALRQGLWSTVRDQLARDFEAVSEDFERSLERIDQEASTTRDRPS